MQLTAGEYFALEEEERGQGWALVAESLANSGFQLAAEMFNPLSAIRHNSALVEIYTKFSDWNTITVQQCFVE